MAYGSGFENRQPLRVRGFESHPHRREKIIAYLVDFGLKSLVSEVIRTVFPRVENSPVHIPTSYSERQYFKSVCRNED